MAIQTAIMASDPDAIFSEAPPLPLSASEAPVFAFTDGCLALFEQLCGLEEQMPPAGGRFDPAYLAFAQEVAAGWARLAQGAAVLARHAAALEADGSEEHATRIEVLGRLVRRLCAVAEAAGDPAEGFGRFERLALLDLFVTGGRPSQEQLVPLLLRADALFRRLAARRREEDAALAALVAGGGAGRGPAAVPAPTGG